MFDYKNHKIALDKNTKRFVLTGPFYDKDESHWFDTYAEATAKVDRTEKVRKRAKQANLNLEVATDAGRVTRIKGLHAKQGCLLFDDGELSTMNAGTFTSVAAYPNIGWITEMLKRKKAIQEELGRITKVLGNYEIKPQRTYGGMSPETFDSIIEKLKSDHHELTMKARNHSYDASGRSAS